MFAQIVSFASTAPFFERKPLSFAYRVSSWADWVPPAAFSKSERTIGPSFGSGAMPIDLSGTLRYGLLGLKA